MEDHEKFREWVTNERGVEINGITAHKFEGRGVGIIAEKRIEVGDILFCVAYSGPKFVCISNPITFFLSISSSSCCLLARSQCFNGFHLWNGNPSRW